MASLQVGLARASRAVLELPDTADRVGQTGAETGQRQKTWLTFNRLRLAVVFAVLKH